ncbi:MAG TPA: DUF3943 domain-containing protein [Acidobacteriota bacterium]
MNNSSGIPPYRIARRNGASRKQAFWWGVLYSTQHELGPFGEAALGNMRTSPVDLLVTPTAGFGLGVLEEWLHPKVRRIRNPHLRRTASAFLGGRLIAKIAVIK